MTDIPILLCMEISDPLMMPDNATGKCSKCSRMLQFRPHAAHMTRICFPCIQDNIDRGEEVKIELNERMAKEAADFLKYGPKH